MVRSWTPAVRAHTGLRRAAGDKHANHAGANPPADAPQGRLPLSAVSSEIRPPEGSSPEAFPLHPFRAVKLPVYVRRCNYFRYMTLVALKCGSLCVQDLSSMVALQEKRYCPGALSSSLQAEEA